MFQNIENLINIPELIITSIENRGDEVHIYCESRILSGHCPLCLEKTQTIKSYNTRKIRDLSVFGKQTYLYLKSRQFHCKEHSEYFYESFTFVNTNAVYTNRFKEFIYQSCKGVDIKYISKREFMSWDTVNDIFKQLSRQQLKAENRMSHVRYLGIDEVSLLKGHKDFATVLVDLETGQVIEFLPERTKEYLTTYFKSLGQEFCNQILIVSSDMWEGFTTLAGSVFPNAEVVVDRFHFFCPSISN